MTENLTRGQKFARSERGHLYILYKRMHFSSSREDRPKKIGKFSFNEFIKWANEHGYQKIYSHWAENKFIQSLSPSIDRKNPLKGYFPSNMQVITQKENFDKGHTEIQIIRGRKVHAIDDGKVYKCFPSLCTAERDMCIFEENIRKVIQGKRITTGGYEWEVCKCRKPKLSTR